MRNPNSLPSSPGRTTTNYGSSSTTNNNNTINLNSAHMSNNNTNPQTFARPQFSMNIWLLRNTIPVVGTTASQNTVECGEPGDLLYGCENDLLDSGTKPLVWGPQPSLHHLTAPKYFCGEALSALLIVRNTSSTATAHNCRVKLELHESAQRRTTDLLNTSVTTLPPNGQSEFRVFTRIVEPGIYTLNSKVVCSSSSTSAADAHHNTGGAGGDTSASATKSISVECDRGIEEATRRVVQLPGQKGPGSARFLVMFCLRNASTVNSAALQHVSLVSKDPAVSVALKSKDPEVKTSSTELLNSNDIHMTELLRVPVTTGSSSTACIDSVMQAGEMRQFVWIVDVVASESGDGTSASGDGGKKSSVSVSAAAALALLTNNSNSSGGGNSSSSSNNNNSAMSKAPINIGVVEWQWRRSAGDGGAIRSSMITSTLTAPTNARGQLAVESSGVQPSPVIVGEPCELTFKITNRGSASIDVNAHVDSSSLLPDFLFVGGSTCIPMGEIDEGDSAELRIPVMPIQSGVFSADAAFQLRDAASNVVLWNGGGNSSSNSKSDLKNEQQQGVMMTSTETNVVCMQAT